MWEYQFLRAFLTQNQILNKIQILISQSQISNFKYPLSKSKSKIKWNQKNVITTKSHRRATPRDPTPRILADWCESRQSIDKRRTFQLYSAKSTKLRSIGCRPDLGSDGQESRQSNQHWRVYQGFYAGRGHFITKSSQLHRIHRILPTIDRRSRSLAELVIRLGGMLRKRHNGRLFPEHNGREGREPEFKRKLVQRLREVVCEWWGAEGEHANNAKCESGVEFLGGLEAHYE